MPPHLQRLQHLACVCAQQCQHLKEEKAVISQHLGSAARDPILRGQINAPPWGWWLWDKENVPVKIVPSGKCSSHRCCSHSGVIRGAFITFVGLICLWTISGYRDDSVILFLTPSGKHFGQGFCFTVTYTLHPGYDGPFWVSLSSLSGGLVTPTFLKCIAACISANNTECPKHGTCGGRSEQLLGIVDLLHFGASAYPENLPASQAVHCIWLSCIG